MTAGTGGAYRWLLVGVGFFAYVVADGSYNINGLFYVAHRRQFARQPAALAAVYGMTYGTGQLLSPLLAAVIRVRGERHAALLSSLCLFLGYALSYFAYDARVLLLTFGLLIPFGSEGCYIFPMTCLARLFDEKLSLACGVAVSGGGIGLLLSAPLVQRLIGEFSWRGACLILAAATLNAGALGLLVRPAARSAAAGARDKPCWSLSSLSALVRPAPIVFFASGVLQAYSIVIIINFVPAMAKEALGSDADITWYPAVFGVSFTAGNLAFGLLGCRFAPLGVDGASILCEACATAALPLAARSGFGVSVGAYAVVGFCYGSRYSLMCPCVRTLSGYDLYEIFHVCYIISFFFGSLPSPFVGQLIRDASGSFDLTFYSAAVVFAAAGALRLLTLLLTRLQSDRPSQEQPPLTKELENFTIEH